MYQKFFFFFVLPSVWMIFYSPKKHPFSLQIIHTGDSCRRVKMRDFCHGISSADLLYNGFSDDASCCPATCSVSREPCHSAQIHGSFTCSRRFENKHTPINQSGTNRTQLQQRRLLGTNCLPARKDHMSKVGTKVPGVPVYIRPSSLSIILSPPLLMWQW